VRTIAQETGLNRKTVSRYIQGDGFPEMAQRRKSCGILDSYTPYLEQRWAEGERNGMQLYREIQQQGYRGSRSRLAMWVAQNRRATPVSAEASVQVPDMASQPPKVRPWSARYAVWLLVKVPETLQVDQQAALARMLAASPVVRRAYAFGQALIRIIREHLSKALDPWLEAVQTYQIPELRRLARSLTQDKAAVRAALVLPWSNGQTEGQINRLKLIKRQMYGRAKFDLLRIRVLARPVV
jgi:transposase